MSTTTLETTPVAPESDHELSIEYEQQIEAFRHQLDARLSTPDLNDGQRDSIIDESFQAVKRIEEEGVFTEDGQLKSFYNENLFTPLDRLADAVGMDIKNITNDEHQQAVKYFCGALLEMIRQADIRNDHQAILSLSIGIQGAYLSSQPDIFMYAGSKINDYLELLSYADRTTATELITSNMKEEVILRGANSKGMDSLFDEQIISAEPIVQLELLNTAASLAEDAMHGGEFNQPFVTKTLEGLRRVNSKHDEVSAFARVAAQAKINNLEQYIPSFEKNRQDFINNPEAGLERIEQQTKEQDRLRTKVESLLGSSHSYGWYEQLSSDSIGVVDNQMVNLVITDQGDRVWLADTDRRNELNFSERDAILLRAIHEPSMKKLIEDELGVAMRDLSLDTQRHLLSFMTEAEPERYERLVQVLNEAGKHRQQLAEAFLTLEFGDDYGNSILSIAENASPEQSNEIFETVNKFREHSAQFAGWFKDFDPALAEAAERAMNERLTDALYAIEALAREKRLEVDVAPHRHTPNYKNDGRFMLQVDSLDEGLTILKNLEHSLALQYEIITGADTQVSRVTADHSNPFALYRFSSETYGDALLYVRPEGAEGYDRNFEYGNRSGVEASVSFIVNPVDPHHLRSDKDPDGVSIRFDREGRTTDELPSGDHRSPIREEGSISLDISSGLGSSDRMPVKIGRLIAAGNLLRANKIGSAESLHHNTNGFDQGLFGSAEGFADLAKYVARMAEAMIEIQRRESLASPRQNTSVNLEKAA